MKSESSIAAGHFLQGLFIACALFSLAVTGAIMLTVLLEALRFFHAISPLDFLFGLHWSPQLAIRDDQAGSSGAFGAVPLFAGTLLIMLIAMFVALPIGLFSAMYMAEYARPRTRTIVKPLLEILAGIPTVVYGYFAIVALTPFLRTLGAMLGIEVSTESALAAGLVMGFMIIPFISSLSDDIITAVPRSLRDASLALGATQSETIRRVVLPAALPGIMGAVLLGVSRAIGETMIVVMAAGLAANLTLNPLSAVTTVTAQIVSLLVGDQAFDSPKTLAAFALGLTLFAVTLLLNVIALYVVKKYREAYE
jgi:phosphate transport system permease protein